MTEWVQRKRRGNRALKGSPFASRRRAESRACRACSAEVWRCVRKWIFAVEGEWHLSCSLDDQELSISR